VLVPRSQHNTAPSPDVWQSEFEAQLVPVPGEPSSPEAPEDELLPPPLPPLLPPPEEFSEPELFPSFPEELPAVEASDPPPVGWKPVLVLPDPPQANRSPAKAALSQSARPLELCILTVSPRHAAFSRHEIAKVPDYQCALTEPRVARVFE
jgi:hypothetical protein